MEFLIIAGLWTITLASGVANITIFRSEPQKPPFVTQLLFYGSALTALYLTATLNPANPAAISTPPGRLLLFTWFALAATIGWRIGRLILKRRRHRGEIVTGLDVY